MARKRTPATPRDPSWRARYALGHKRHQSADAYSRADSRATERAAGRT